MNSYRALSLAGLAVLWLGTAMAAPDARRQGVLILAHGGSAEWNASVERAVADARLSYPTAIAFGMGMTPQDVSHIEHAVTHLSAQGVTEILAVPLLVSSHSEVYRQYEYLLGLRADSPWPNHTPQPLQLSVPVRLGTALDAHPYLAEIVVERASALSRDAIKEVVILVAHGPTDEADNAAWLAQMRTIAKRLRAAGGFADVEACTLRDDAPADVQAQATATLRALVEQHSRSARVLIVPLLIARGGIEQKIPQRLAGLRFTYAAETLLPHPRVAQWIRETVEALRQVRGATRRDFWYNWSGAPQASAQDSL